MKEDQINKYIELKLKENNLEDKYVFRFNVPKHIVINKKGTRDGKEYYYIKYFIDYFEGYYHISKNGLLNMIEQLPIISKIIEPNTIEKFKNITEAIDFVITLILTNDFDIFEGNLFKKVPDIDPDIITDKNLNSVKEYVENIVPGFFDKVSIFSKRPKHIVIILQINDNYGYDVGINAKGFPVRMKNNQTKSFKIEEVMKKLIEKYACEYNVISTIDKTTDGEIKTKFYNIELKNITNEMIQMEEDFDLFENKLYENFTKEQLEFIKDDILEIFNKHNKENKLMYTNVFDNVNIEYKNYTITLSFRTRGSYNYSNIEKILKEIQETYKCYVNLRKSEFGRYLYIILNGLKSENILPYLTLKKDFDLFDELSESYEFETDDDVNEYIKKKISEFGLEKKLGGQINNYDDVEFYFLDKHKRISHEIFYHKNKYEIWTYDQLIRKTPNAEYEKIEKFDSLKDAIDHIISLVVTKDFDIFESINNDYNKLLLNSAKNGDLNGVKKALLNDDNLDIQNKYKYTALIYASEHGYTEIAKYLIDNKANLDIQNRFGDTALMWAIANGHTEIAKYLIDNKANLDIQNKYKYTALISASNRGHTQIAKYLIDNKANLDIQNKYKFTALIYASANGHTEIVKYLIDNDANMDIQNNDGYTALIYASYYGYTEIAKYLIDNKANLDIQNKYGNTALISASCYGQTEIAKYLIDNGANLDIQSKYGNTALISASANGHTKICKLIATKILETQPYRAHELLKYLTDKQKQQYKEFIVANRDFDIFESLYSYKENGKDKFYHNKEIRKFVNDLLKEYGLFKSIGFDFYFHNEGIRLMFYEKERSIIAGEKIRKITYSVWDYINTDKVYKTVVNKYHYSNDSTFGKTIADEAEYFDNFEDGIKYAVVSMITKDFDLFESVNNIDFNKLLKELDKLGLDKKKYAIFGSGPLAVRNKTLTSDIDVILMKDYYIKKFGEKEPIKKGNIELSYSFPGIRNPENLIKNAETINGHPYVKLKYVLKYKLHMNRKKDQDDIKILKKLLEGNQFSKRIDDFTDWASHGFRKRKVEKKDNLTQEEIDYVYNKIRIIILRKLHFPFFPEKYKRFTYYDDYTNNLTFYFGCKDEEDVIENKKEIEDNVKKLFDCEVKISLMYAYQREVPIPNKMGYDNKFRMELFNIKKERVAPYMALENDFEVFD